ncbi:GH32 C-terminal domain-containing protein [Pseudarthrobacter sulfonivorans]|uniref:GH32 C-terminal domain-containing protein n=1 Tax=Pseudarthrobacter sulfonivorans TaxID=121292 RepID=UPI00285452C5|nr:GH32 C-terminal domain-containing protein [Pseudarthrobacter sulfonivorans]MDR6416601.1 levanase [Pseudarthrobacter sulfonivorans]
MKQSTMRRTRSVSALTLASLSLAAALAGSMPASAAELGDEQHRPAIHYSPEKNWMNDPNGLVFHKGVYHMYYQHNPSGNTWGNMSWGHATSKDLVHWEEQPLAISTDAQEDVFSGSIVVDKNNTSGLGTAENPPLIAIYTSAYKEASTHRGLQAQSLAYSLDDGQTWTKYDGNPVLSRNSANFRDPKVFWYDNPAGGSYWVMTAVEAQEHKVVLYKSDNLKDWTALSEFGPANATGGQWECPDLFPLAVDGDPNNVKWVMIVSINPGGVAGGSAGQYFVGNFDGTTFTSETTKPAATLPAGTVLAGFNDGTYNGWTVNNEPGNWKNGPFGDAPAAGSLPGQSPVTGFGGTGLVNSFNDGDWPVGTMKSPAFTVSQDYLNFLVGGGNHPRTSDRLDNTPPQGELLFDGFEVPAGTTLADFGWTGTGDIAPQYQPFAGGGDHAIGTHVINTFESNGGGDEKQGTLISPAFTITKNNLSMLVGGGNRSNDPNQTLAVQLLVNGEIKRSVAGENAGALNWKAWDVAEFRGQQAQIRVVDQATGGWGHLTLDHVMQTDAPAVPRSDETTVNLEVGGQVVRTATGSNSEALDLASWNVKEFAGQQANISIIDNNRGGWGHILADEFMLSAKPAVSALETYDWLDYGRDYYAAVSFGNMPDDKRIMLGWMSNWDYANDIPTSPWRSAMALPREVKLTQTPDGPRLTQSAVKQVEKLGGKVSYNDKKGGPISAGTHPLPAQSAGQIQQVDITFTPGTATKSGLTVLGDEKSSTVIGYDATTGKMFVDRRNSGNTTFHPAFASIEDAPVTLDKNGNITLRIYLDRSSVEVFAQNGLRTITDQVFPNPGADKMALFAEGGTAQLKSLTVTPLEKAMFLPEKK